MASQKISKRQHYPPPPTADQPSAKEDEDSYLAFLNDQLAKTSSGPDRASIYNRRAAHYAKKAQEAAKVAHLGSLKHWQKALEDYRDALELIKHHETSALGYMQCLVGLSKYGQALEYFQTHASLNNNPDAWIIASIAHRKQCRYQKAKGYILEALRRDPKSQEAVKQKSLLEKCSPIKERIEERLAKYKEVLKDELKCEQFYFNDRSRNNKRQYYTILSLDGGGVKGVLPALWLSEIESRAKRPISHLFNMLAGTSTGAIVAAGLSAPKTVPKIREEASYQPRYSALDIVNIYREKSSTIFNAIPGVSYVSSLVGSKYSASGRSSIFKTYFGQARLKQSLTELVIPAVSGDDFSVTHLFSRYASLKDSTKDSTLHDVLMATTAAPTFFPSYQIPTVGSFVDGAIQANNPALSAYNEALKYIGTSQKRIFMLSMGAGTCIPDPLEPDYFSGKLFWAGKFPRVSITLQEGDTDRAMRTNLPGHYQRWQVWLERPIGIDAYDKMDTLLELGQQYLEELYDSDENTMNKLLEFLEENQAPQG